MVKTKSYQCSLGLLELFSRSKVVLFLLPGGRPRFVPFVVSAGAGLGSTRVDGVVDGAVMVGAGPSLTYVSDLG